MYRTKYILSLVIMAVLSNTCTRNNDDGSFRILFLHHSTGQHIWTGNTYNPVSRLASRLHPRLGRILNRKPELPELFRKYNDENSTGYSITEQVFPKLKPYGWHNYPYDYYIIWVKNAGENPYMEEPTLEMLTKKYNMIIFKHCFPVSNILPDSVSADPDSDIKTLSNYKFQYNALKEKLKSFPETRFLLFTGAAQVRKLISEPEASRAREFFEWVKNDWDQPGDNIFIWDLFELQTEGGLFFVDKYAVSENDSHPSPEFSSRAARLLFNRIVDIIETNGEKTTIRGEKQ